MTSSPAATTTDVQDATTPPPPSPPPASGADRRWPAGRLVLGALAASVAISLVALLTASGETFIGNSNYDTEYASGWWSLAWALPLIPAVTAFSRVRVALWQGLAIVVTQLATAGVVVYRYIDAGWGSGLEFFAFAMPIALVFITAGLIGVGAIIGHTYRSARQP